MCKRWRDLAHSPALLRDVYVHLQMPEPDEPHDRAAALEGSVLSFFSWLRRHTAPHVQWLSISLGRHEDEEFETYADERFAAELRSALRACTQLQHLELDSPSKLELCGTDFGAWVGEPLVSRQGAMGRCACSGALARRAALAAAPGA